ncbi:MAG: hypothetical protein JW772_05460 [Candidatus Diapherotrites archaeon]|nr:hypothetical protein [Candidatus Diapherotrites archaeon]
MAVREINTIYWITHPGYTIAYGKRGWRNSTEAMEIYFERVLKPVVKRAQTEPNSVIVLVKTPVMTRDLAEEKLGGYTQRGLDKLQVLEMRFEDWMRRIMKKRALVAEGFLPQTIATDANTKLKRANLSLAENARIIGYGSYRDVCARTFPMEFITFYCPNGKLIRSEQGTIGQRTGFRRKPRAKRTTEKRQIKKELKRHK